MEVIFCRFMSTVHAWECSAPHFSGILANTATKMKKNFASCYGNWKSLLGAAIKVVPTISISNGYYFKYDCVKRGKQEFAFYFNWQLALEMCRGQWFFSIYLIPMCFWPVFAIAQWSITPHNFWVCARQKVLAKWLRICHSFGKWKLHGGFCIPKGSVDLLSHFTKVKCDSWT